MYSQCQDSADVVRVQNEYIAKIEQDHLKRRDNFRDLLENNPNHSDASSNSCNDQDDVDSFDSPSCDDSEQELVEVDRFGNIVIK